MSGGFWGIAVKSTAKFGSCHLMGAPHFIRLAFDIFDILGDVIFVDLLDQIAMTISCESPEHQWLTLPKGSPLYVYNVSWVHNLTLMAECTKSDCDARLALKLERGRPTNPLQILDREELQLQNDSYFIIPITATVTPLPMAEENADH
jgi:hypothetical protein